GDLPFPRIGRGPPSLHRRPGKRGARRRPGRKRKQSRRLTGAGGLANLGKDRGLESEIRSPNGPTMPDRAKKKNPKRAGRFGIWRLVLRVGFGGPGGEDSAPAACGAAPYAPCSPGK